MEPVLRDGEIVCVDPARTSPVLRDIVVIRIAGRGSIIGYWMTRDFACLGKANPAFGPVLLDALSRWEVAGTVIAVIADATPRPAPPPRDERRIDDVLDQLSSRVKRRLHAIGVHTIGELVARSAEELRSFKGVGEKTHREILYECARLGLLFPEQQTR
jgi:hypothetical protein